MEKKIVQDPREEKQKKKINTFIPTFFHIRRKNEIFLRNATEDKLKNKIQTQTRNKWFSLNYKSITEKKYIDIFSNS